MNKDLSVRDQLLEAGMKAEDLGNWCSDLYVKKTPISENFVNNYEFKCNVRTFRCNIDNKTWYDIPFAYQEYHTKRMVH